MKTKVILVATILISTLTFAQIKMEKVSLIDEKVELNSPTELKPMSGKMWAFKYPNRPKPVFVVSDENAEVNLLGDLTNQPADESQLASFKDFQISNLKKSKPDLKILEQGVKVVNGKKVGFFKFISQAVDQKVFNYYFFTIVDGKILIFSFNCIESLQNKWEKIADEIVGSLKIK